MSTAGPSSRSARAPGTDWEDSFFNLDSRYRQLQKRFNEQQEELKQAKVNQRREAAATARRSAAVSPIAGGGRARGLTLRSNTFTSQNTGLPQANAGATLHTPPQARSTNDHKHVGLSVDSPSMANDATASALHVASLLGSDPGAGLPDPAMIWGAEGSVQNYVAANALYHANEELRRKLSESSTLVQTLQTELSSMRTLCTNAQARIEDLAQQMHQLVRERDLASQKLATARQSISDFEHTLQSRTNEEERARFSLESQIAELRSRLVVGADSNELLTRDVRALLSETKEKTSEVMSLRSKLALAEAGLSSQRSTNESLLLELKNLNGQLVEERKRLLVAAREVQAASLVRDRVVDLEGQVRRLLQERAAVEGDHNRLMSDFVSVTEDALRHAREEVRADLDDWRHAAAHWEEVSQLLYKDVSERIQAHIRCRAECNEAKAQRDMVGVELRSAKEELALCRAKLDVVWPTHTRDAEGLSADEVLETFRRRRATFRKDADERGDTGENKTSDGDADHHSGGPSAAATYAEALSSLPVDSTTTSERIYELQEANAALVAELEQLRLTNDLLQDRVASVKDHHEKDTQRLQSAAKDVEDREKAGQRVLAQQLDRVQFLEAQVRSLRGYQVSPDTAVQDVAPTENVLELFLGQLVGAEVPTGVDIPEVFSQLFCSADFLLHETVTTPTVTGLNGFFDTTICFRISMDTLLLYYLRTRKLLVQLHRICGHEEMDATFATGDDASAGAGTTPGETKGITDRTPNEAGSSPSSERTVTMAERMFKTVAEGEVSLLELVTSPECLDAVRPTLKGHVRLVTPTGRHIASLEFQLTARTPFTEEFKQIVRDATFEPPADGKEEHGVSGKREAPRPSRVYTRQDRRGSGSPDPDTDASSSASSRSGVREWLHRSSSTTSSSFERGVRHAQMRPARTEKHKLHGGTRTGMQLVSAPSDGGRRRVCEGDTGTSSLDSSSYRGGLAPDAYRRRGSEDILRLRLRGNEGNSTHLGLPTIPPSLPPSDSSFAHIARSLLPGSGGGGDKGYDKALSAFNLSPTSPHCFSGLTQAIHSVAVDVVRLELPADLATPIPRLSCFYSLPALRHEVRLHAPASPQYTVEYQQPDARYGTVCSVASLTDLAALAREPVTFFFIDEDAPRGSPAVWAMALCEWTGALKTPGVAQAFSLPLLQQATGVGGKLERRLVRGGVLRVRLIASTESSPSHDSQQQQHPRWQAEESATAPVHSFLSENQETPEAKAPSVAAPWTAPSPSPLTALQQLIQQVRVREQQQQQTLQGQPKTTAVASACSASPLPAPSTAPTAQQTLSMNEQLMQLEYERMMRRQ